MKSETKKIKRKKENFENLISIRNQKKNKLNMLLNNKPFRKKNK